MLIAHGAQALLPVWVNGHLIQTALEPDLPLKWKNSVPYLRCLRSEAARNPKKSHVDIGHPALTHVAMQDC